MKIYYAANTRIPTEKANGLAILKQCEAFANLGHDVTLLLPRRRNTIKENPFEYYDIKPSFSVVRIPLIDTVSRSKIGFLFESLQFSVFSFVYLLANRPDLLYSRDETCLYLPSFAGFFGGHSVYEPHTEKSNFAIRRVIKCVDLIVPISGGLERHYIGLGMKSDESLVLPSGVDTEQFKNAPGKEDCRLDLGLPKNEIIVGYVGKYLTMGVQKGVDDLIEAFSIIKKGRKGTHLLIAGLEVNEFDIVKEKCQANGLNSKDFSLLKLNQRSFADYLVACDVLVLSYPRERHYEHFMSPTKLFAYMASGVPIVTTDLSSIREIVSDDQVTFARSGSAEDLASGIKETIINTNRALQKAQASKAEVRKYTWEKRAQSVLNFLSRELKASI